jgi:hypothetical protein
MSEVLIRDAASFKIVHATLTGSRAPFAFALDILTTDAIFIEVSRLL